MRATRLLPILLIAAIMMSASLGLVSCGKEGEETAAGGGEIEWLTAYEEAMDQAKDKNRPVMIDFYTDWCSWCKQLDRTTYVDATVVKKSEKFISLKIDADGQRSLAARYRVGAFPTILFINPEGLEIHRVVGFRPAVDFLKEMDTALGAFKRSS
ncbi:MAG: thioredoxin domain-containing protein [bacterium]|jgi:thiol:disulfide interchange protein